MHSHLSVASVTVATNAAPILAKQMEALLHQSRVLDEIIVVNNGSTDNTLELLSSNYPQVKVLNLPGDFGVGGGFSAGLQYAALTKKHDWVWLLDDDSVPRHDGLEQLLRGLREIADSPESVAVLAPIPVHGSTKLSYPGLLWRRWWVTPSAEAAEQSISYVDVVISSGSLIRGNTIEKVGLPRSDFFMDFVDYELCLRFRRAGYKIAVVRDSLLDHSLGSLRIVNILGYSRPWSDHAPWREYYMSRNHTFTIWNYYPDWKSKLSVAYRLLRHLTGIIAFGQNKVACLKMMYLGFQDGRSGKLGIRFSDGSLPGNTEGAPIHPVKSASD